MSKEAATTPQATTLEEVAEFCRKAYRDVTPAKAHFSTDEYVQLGMRTAYAAVYRIITGRHPDTEGSKE